MRRFLLAVLIWLAVAVGTRAQASGFTQVSAVVLDPSGNPYAGCHGNSAFVPAPSATTVPTIGGSTFQTDVPINGCDSFGAFTTVLADNNVVQDGHTSPPASQWRFNISSQDGKTSFFCIISITGLSMNITTQLQACAPPLSGGGGGGGSKGSMYRFNIAGSTPLTAGNFQFSGWGTGATISGITGTDTAFTFTMTAGTTPTINPTVTLTFADGPWTSIYSVNAQTDNGSGNQTFIQTDPTLTNVKLTYLNLPQATKTYTITATVVGTTNIGNIASPLNAVVMNPQGDQTVQGSHALILQGPVNIQAPLTQTGTSTFTGLMQCKNFEQIRCVDTANSQAWGGTGAAGWIAAAYADLPATGGDILVAAGNYSLGAGIVFATANKPARLLCAPGGATTLTFTPTTGVAFTYNVAGVTGSHQWGEGLENCTLSGPGAGTTSTGILLGGTNGAEGVVRRNVKVSGFGTAEVYGNNTFLTECLHCVYIDNGVDLSIPNTLSNSGESFSYIDSAFANSSGSHNASCVNVAAPVNNLSFTGGSFDNCQLAMSAGQIHVVSVHFENPNSGMTVPFINQTGGRLSLINPDMQWNAFAAPTPSAAVSCSAGLLTANNETFFSGTTTIASDYLLSGTCEFHETGMKLTSGFTNFYLTSTSGSISTFGNIWASNQLIGAGDFLLSGGKLRVGTAGGNPYTFVPVNPATFRNVGISDPGSDFQMGSTLNATSGVYQSKRGTAGCTTAASAGAGCSFTVTWPGSFPGTNYSATCTPSGGNTNLPSAPFVTTKTATTILVNYVATTAAAATWAFVDCTGVMD